MSYAFFPGCKIPYYLPHYGTATRAVLRALEIPLTDVEFNCCGYPTRMLDAEAWIYSAARNLALAEALGLDILTPCKCCFGSLKHARHWLRQDPQIKAQVNARLAGEGLAWRDIAEVKHLLTVLSTDVATDKLAARIIYPFHGLNIAVHYGCHALRPAAITEFDDALDPSLFESLVEVTGARCVQWEQRLACCGNPLWEKNSDLSLKLMHRKLDDARTAGADYLCAACTYCQIQFDTVQYQQLEAIDQTAPLASILYPQL